MASAQFLCIIRLVAFHPGSEQDASETRRFLTQFRRLTHLGATVVLIHHTGKAETAQTYRGSSDIKAAVDCAYLLQPLDSESGLGRLRLRSFKNRVALGASIEVQYEAGGWHERTDRALTNREIIEDLLRAHPGAGQDEILELARVKGVSRDRTRELLAEGEQQGWLEVETGKKGKKTYRLAEVEVGEI